MLSPCSAPVQASSTNRSHTSSRINAVRSSSSKPALPLHNPLLPPRERAQQLDLRIASRPRRTATDTVMNPSHPQPGQRKPMAMARAERTELRGIRTRAANQPHRLQLSTNRHTHNPQPPPPRRSRFPQFHHHLRISEVCLLSHPPIQISPQHLSRMGLPMQDRASTTLRPLPTCPCQSSPPKS